MIQAPDIFTPIISVDDHVLEPPDIFEARVPRNLKARVPYVRQSEDGVPQWIIEGDRLDITVTNGASGLPRNLWGGGKAFRYEEFRDGVWNSKKRLGDMDLAGIWASVCFPSLIFGFAGRVFSQLEDREAGFAALRAYNDWMIEEWCAASPDRYVRTQLPWLRDPQVAAEEIRRNAVRGFQAVSFSENPEVLGFGSLHDSTWDPFFLACQETSTVINLHVGSSGELIQPSKDSPHESMSALFPLSGVIAAVNWVHARIPIRFPDIKICLSEAGVTWVPMVAERLQRSYRGLEVTKIWKPEDPQPEELLHRNFWFCSIEDPVAFSLLDVIDPKHLMVECDYPHTDSTWPETQSVIRREMLDLPAETVKDVCFRNAATLYRHPEPSARWMSEVGYLVAAPESLQESPIQA
jgi:predicted TIM-barrel fold metal-dependent hydrolase